SAGSSIRKVRASVSKYGFRAGIADSLARWGQSRLKVPQDVLEDYGWILNQDRPETLPAPDSGPLRINWLISDPGTASGGLLGVLRAIYYLEQWGHKHRVYVVGRTTSSASQLTKLVRRSYFPIEAQLEIFNGEV